MSKGFDIICLTPPGFAGTGFIRASIHASFQGGISFEYADKPLPSAILDGLNLSKTGWCLCVSLNNEPLLQILASAPPAGLTRIILCDAESRSLSPHVNALRAVGMEVFVQVLDVDEAKAAQAAGADAILVKGNEAGGRVGEETTFILLQRVRQHTTLPVWVRGGIGLRTAAACVVGGAAGAVLDWQLALCEESELPEDVKARISRMDGSETAILGQGCRLRYRAFSRAGEIGFHQLRETEERLGLDLCTDAQQLASWRSEVENCICGPAKSARVLLIGQDAAFAASLADEYKSVGSIAEAIRREAVRLPRMAARQKALRPGGPMAASHGTRFPILQGPMTRVSDVADFAEAVAAGGGLPFLALALLRGPQVDTLLEETKQKLGSKPWGVGILGFVPKELRDEQLAEVRKHPPPFAIIAGGRPDQALELEREGIATYLHVPSPGLLSMFLKSGARRVIFEGRECGGHVGPRSSFVLWESMIQTLLDHLDATGDSGSDYHVAFAGGIHDARSAAMVAALSATLAERDVRVGVLIGTAYLFTNEAVRSGAIVKGFQDEAVKCRQTILLESGVGHATRCADTEFGRTFLDEKKRLIREGRTKEEIREALERLNLGRLRIASKAIMRDDSLEGEQQRGAFVSLDDTGQKREGMYMIGQVAALRDRVCSIEELHTDISLGGTELLDSFAKPVTQSATPRRNGPSDIAIIGMSCLLPKASNKERFWENILNGVRCTEEVPADRWDSDLYFSKDRRARDNSYSKWGGFIDPVAFDPMRYGMPPNSIPSVEPLQLLVLEAVRHALQDAGYADKPFDRENTSVILGAGGGVGEHGLGYGFRSMALHYLTAAGSQIDEVKALLERLDGKIPEWTEDSFAGLLLNVAAGRVANRFDLGGTNYTVDAACASSLAAVRLAVEELESGSSNMVVVGGADTMQSPFAYLCFSNTQALSPTGASRPFDAAADGIVISEGIAIAILKRLEDAERDGDCVYAVIKGVGSSSDGKDKGLTAPRPAGQIRALERAYAKAGFSPETVGLFEAHGTGTVVGDQSEAESLTRALTASGAKQQSAALGSVKSMLGHTKCTAGVAGLLKAALALHHKVLPPTIGVTQPNPRAKFEESPLYVNSESRPWLQNGSPRRAGVSAFGFGGTNFHAVLEEYAPGPLRLQSGNAGQITAPGRLEWPAELFVWRASKPNEILQALDIVSDALATGSKPILRDLAGALARQAQKAPPTATAILAIVAGSLADLSARMLQARKIVEREVNTTDPTGIYFSSRPAFGDGCVALLFPGQGSQSVNMLRDLAIASPLVRSIFERADSALKDRLDTPLSNFVFPLPAFTDTQHAANEKSLTQTQVAQPALGAADSAMLHLLGELGVTADFLAGHSYGEYVALYAAGVLSFEDLMRVSEARGRLISTAGAKTGGTMAAVVADQATVSELLAGIDDVWCANFNSPTQTVISGTESGIGQALERFATRRISARRINVSSAFHSPLVQDATGPFGEALRAAKFSPPQKPVFSNTTARAYENDPCSIREHLIEHLVKPVRFAEQLQAMHDAGARVFVEVGPGRVLSGLVDQTLKGRPFVSIALNAAGRDAVTSLMHGLGQLASAGVRFDLRPLTENRTTCDMDVTTLLEQSRPAELSRTTWMITGAKAVPLHAASKGAAIASPKPSVSHSLPNKTAQAASSTPVDKSPAVRSFPQSTTNGLPLPQTNIGNVAPSHAVAASSSHLEAMMASHQQLMARFLDTHRNVMLNLLGQGGLSAVPGTPAMPRNSLGATSAPVQPPREFTAPAHDESQINDRTETPMAQNGADGAAAEHPFATPVQTSGPKVDPREQITQALVSIVADRTGYPPDMLELDLDLEADLGIDSIKRVEILGALQEGSALPGQSVAGDMESLSKVKSLRGIVNWLVEKLGANESDPPRMPDPPRQSNTTSEPLTTASNLVGSELPRMSLRAVDHPLDVSSQRAVTGAVVIIDDELGVATAVAEKLRASGVPVEVAHVIRGLEHNGSHPRINLADPTVAQGWCNHIREKHGRIGAILHLLPLAGSTLGQKEPQQWITPLETELHSLFNVVQAAEADLRQDGGRIIAITRLSGAFGSVDGGTVDYWPGSGAVCGLVKTLAREWPGTISRVVDAGPTATIDQIVSMTLAELTSADPIAEVGYWEGRRVALLPSNESLADRNPSLALTKDSVLLITGGARGITAECAIELARQYSCRLVLLGRAALPSEHESDPTSGITDTKQLKSALLQSMSATGEKVTPALVEAAYSRLMRERETRQNLSAMRAAGSTVEYHAVDVADSAAFGHLIDDVYRRHGRIDGVIHGAGIIEDKLIRDKSLDSFRRVCDPKIRGALTLASKIRPASLSFMVFFSSVSGRYGNRGQADYAAANEVLDKLALFLNARWKARVAALIWGPWESTGGMVSDELARQFAKAGIHIVSRAQGRVALVDEISKGRKDEAEVVFGGPLNVSLQAQSGASAQEAAPVSPDDRMPLLKVHSKATRRGDNSLVVVRDVDPASDVYLSDHQLDGRPVMPMAMMQELFAEVALLSCPKLNVAAVRDLRVLRGISFEKGSQQIRVATAPPVWAKDSARVNLQAFVGNQGQVYDTAEVELLAQLPAAPPFAPLKLLNPRPLPMSVADAYEQWLFHGPIFAGIVEVDSLGENGVIAQLAPSTPTRCLTQSPTGDWLIDPVMVDSALQLIILWARVFVDMTPLPARLTCYHRFAGPIKHPVRCEATVQHPRGTPVILADFRFIDASGRLVGWLEGLEGTCSKALNRLAETRAHQVVEQK